MKRLPVCLLVALGALAQSGGVEDGPSGIRSAALDFAPAVADIRVRESAAVQTGTVQPPVRSRNAGSRPRPAPIVREFAPPAPKTGPSFRQFKTAAFV